MVPELAHISGRSDGRANRRASFGNVGQRLAKIGQHLTDRERASSSFSDIRGSCGSARVMPRRAMTEHIRHITGRKSKNSKPCSAHSRSGTQSAAGGGGGCDSSLQNCYWN